MHTSSNPFAYNKPITLDTLSELFTHHRGLTGGWSMEGDGGDGGSGGAGDGGNGSGDGGDGSGGSGGAGGNGGGYTAPATQADLDRIVGERLSRERQKYADYSELKKKAEAHDKALEDAMDEQQKAVAAARKEGESAAAQAANGRLVAAEARALAAESGFRIGAASVVRLLDLSDIAVDDNGEVDKAAIQSKLNDLKTNEPDLAGEVKKTPKRDHSQGGGGGTDKPSVDRGREMYESRRGGKKTT